MKDTDKEKLIKDIADRNFIINQYKLTGNIDRAEAIRKINELRISDKTRLYAKRKLEEEENKIFECGSGFTMETIVGTEATRIMIRVYSDREGVENVGHALGYSRRLLETKLKNWMTAVVDNMTYSSEYSPCKVDVTTQAGGDWEMASCRKKQSSKEVENEKI